MKRNRFKSSLEFSNVSILDVDSLIKTEIKQQYV